MVYNPSIDYSGSGMPRKTGSLISKKFPDHANRVWKVTTAPVLEPVTVDEVKIFSKSEYEETKEDTLLEGFITTVRLAAEEYLGMAFIEQTIQMKMDYWPDIFICLPQPPLISVTKICTLDEDDTETEYSSGNYYVITEGHPGKVILKKDIIAPQNTDRDYGGFFIEYKAGYGSEATDVPESIRNGIKAWTAIVQATRVIDTKNPPPEAKIFFDLYRRGTFVIR